MQQGLYISVFSIRTLKYTMIPCLEQGVESFQIRMRAEKGNRGPGPKQFGGSEPRFLEANVSGTRSNICQEWSDQKVYHWSEGEG